MHGCCVVPTSRTMWQVTHHTAWNFRKHRPQHFNSQGHWLRIFRVCFAAKSFITQKPPQISSRLFFALPKKIEHFCWPISGGIFNSFDCPFYMGNYFPYFHKKGTISSANAIDKHDIEWFSVFSGFLVRCSEMNKLLMMKWYYNLYFS